ncbi:MAG: NAD(P)H-dependent oxidoreductase [Verrucomicrobiae bacterium]|nr:NAD(P)H-dependent oxidoreductase [Verrucomicrobiae bacterium]
MISQTEPAEMTRQIEHALAWRYATKQFDPNRKIPPEIWAALQHALIMAPSSFGLQPYRFVVVDDPAVRAKLLPHAYRQRQVVDASHFVVFAARTRLTEHHVDHFIDRIVEVRGGARESLSTYRQMMIDSLVVPTAQSRVPHWAARQCYIALGFLLLSAALLGVDACPMEGFDPAGFDEVLHLPAQGFSAVVCCALGYRLDSDKYAHLPKVRFPPEELIQRV